MPLSQSELEALDPSDPADAAILQEEALAYLASTETLTGEVADLEVAVEDAELLANANLRRALIAKVATQPRAPAGIRLAKAR